MERERERESISVSLHDKLIMYAIFLAGFALMLTSLYIQWTPYMADTVQGVQGRYFIPLLLYLLIPLGAGTGHKSSLPVGDSIGNVPAQTINVSAVLSVILNIISLYYIRKFFS